VEQWYILEQKRSCGLPLIGVKPSGVFYFLNEHWMAFSDLLSGADNAEAIRERFENLASAFLPLF
jgi:hypothetical protein